MSDTSAIPPDGFFSWAANKLYTGEVLDQHSAVGFVPTFDAINKLKPSFASRFS